MSQTKKRRALLSVFDKTGLYHLAEGLCRLGFELLASGGTAKSLRDDGLAVTEIQDVTQSPEVLGGRVKTLHPRVHAGILSRRTAQDTAELETLGALPIDVVVCNLYPFEKTIATRGSSLGDAIEQIDIGGVALLRAAAKNFRYVTAVPDPRHYDEVLDTLAGGDVRSLNRRLATATFRLTASYEMAIADYLSEGQVLHLAYERQADLRYGENPHQAASFYTPVGGAAPFEQLAGKPLSYNNLIDMDAARAAAYDFARPTVAIIKHTNPCGLASADDVVSAFDAALESDPVSAFGSIIACNERVTRELCRALGKLYVEVIVAPSFSKDAKKWLAKHKKKCRLVVAPQGREPGSALERREIVGGLLVQDRDQGLPDQKSWSVVTEREPTREERRALDFAWRVVRHVKSNAIVICRGEATVGVGAGQMNRLDAVELAAKRAGERAAGAVLASDAFFPFADGLEAAAAAGVTAVIQPGGSIRDAEVIAAADRLGIAMIVTGRRHFKH